jgi:surface polysaccharide O-acyltransferase-like enzyme
MFYFICYLKYLLIPYLITPLVHNYNLNNKKIGIHHFLSKN